MREPIVISWEAWKASREAKRETLRRAGLAMPSRRTKSVGSADARLRKAFAGRRVPDWAEVGRSLTDRGIVAPPHCAGPRQILKSSAELKKLLRGKRNGDFRAAGR